MKIGLFTDSHYCSAENRCVTRRPVLSLNKINEAIDDFVENKVDAIICLGDLLDSDASAEKDTENLSKIGALIKASGIESYCCMGNHDAFLFDKTEFELLSGLKTAPYTFAKESKRFILLDANYTSQDERYSREGFDWTDTKIPEAELAWLKKTLSESKESKIIIFIHQNLDASLDKHYLVSNAMEVCGLFSDDGRITAVYQGHYHLGANTVVDGIPCITLKAMCESIENHYEIIEL